MMNPMMLMQIKGAWDRFCRNHPRFMPFVQAVGQEGIQRDTVISIEIKSPEGKTYQTNILVKDDDIELFQMIKNMKM